MNKTADHKTRSTTAARPANKTFNVNESTSSFFDSENETISRSPFFAQAKLTVGKSNDPSEKEADAAADKALNYFTRPSTVQAKTAESPLHNNISPVNGLISRAPGELLTRKEEEGEEELQQEKVQRKPIFESAADPLNGEELLHRKSSGNDAAIPGDLDSRLAQSKGSGQSLPDPVRSPMEQAFNADFSGVRTHTGTDAVQMSSDLGAQAFTHGNDIYFNEGKYDTNSKEGQHLIAHELTHTVQQGAAPVQKKSLQKNNDLVQAKNEAPLTTAAPREFTSLTTPDFSPSKAVDE